MLYVTRNDINIFILRLIYGEFNPVKSDIFSLGLTFLRLTL